MTLTAKDILGAADISEPVKLEIPEWKGHVFIKLMTGSERDEWEMELGKAARTGKANVRATLCALTACDEAGERLFTIDQIDELGKKSGVALDRIFARAQRINKLSKSDLEELEGN